VADSTGAIKYREDTTYDGAAFSAGAGVNACPTGAAQHDDNNYGCGNLTRGLPTSVTKYTDAATPGGAVTKNLTYDFFGNLRTAQLNCCQQKQWNYSATTQYSYPDAVVSGAGSTQLTTSATYYFPTGQVATSTDENGQQTVYTYTDVGHLNRLTIIKRPDNANITYTYNDAQRTVTVTTPISSASSVQKITAFDPLGRPLTTTVKDGSSNTYSVFQVQYEALGRTYKSSNPYTGSPQFWTTSQFDAIGRPTVTILPDSNQTNYSYATTSITVTDPTGKQRASKSDGLGRMVEIDEPGSSPGTPGTGSSTVNGTEQSIAAIAATPGTGSVTIGGTERLKSSNPCYPHGTCIIQIYDSGTVDVKVNGFDKSVGYGQSDTQSSIASNLANAFNSDSSSPVTASASNSIVYFTSKATGSTTNYSLTTTAFTTNTTYFTGTSFTATPSGATLTGGADAKSAIYDSGTVWISVNGTQYSASYGSSSTTGSLAIALANTINASSPMVTASPSGATVTLTAKQAGSSTNYPLSSGSSTGQPGSFSQPSFTLAVSGSALTGGADSTPLSLSTPAITLSTYNVLDQLTQATEGAQSRKFNYDGMGRLQSSTTAESGTVCFGTLSGSTCQANGYDSFDNLLYRTDARGVQTNFSYDGLNRLYQIAYNVGSTGVPATPTVTLTYGTSAAQFNNGRLITMTDGVGSENYSYNNLGEVTQLQKVISGTTYTTGYAYNLAGEMTQIKYPSGRVVQQSFDAIGRLCEVAPSTTGCSTAVNPYATAYGYNTASQVTGFNYGNGVVAALGFSPDRLQLTSLNYTKGSTNLFGLTYGYSQNGGNNGQITNITEPAEAGQSVNYSYDALGRLSTAVSVGSANFPKWGLSFTYDRYGNRTAETPTAGSGMPSNSVAVDATNNRINSGGYAYDLSGNMTNDGSNTLAYDAVNRAVSATSGSGTYGYDGNGLRVKKVAGGTTTVYVFSGSKVIAEYDNGAAVASPSREYIYSGSVMLAKIEGGSTIYYHADHLSARLLTDSNGNSLGQRGHYPFGETWYETGTATKFKFTAYERDTETGNDFAMARYDVNRLGRFATPDPLSGSSANPQSLNRYSYTGNDPINYADPTGQFIAPMVYNLFHNFAGLSNGGFGTGWNEFDLFMPIGTANLYHADNANFRFEDFTSGELAEFKNEGEITLLSSSPIYGLFMIAGSGGDPGQGPGGDRIADVKALARGKILNNEKCRAFIETLLTFLYGGPQTAQRAANRLDAASFNFLVGPGQDPNAGPLAATLQGSFQATIYPRGTVLTNNDLAVTFIHETFHMGPQAKTDQQMWQAAIGNPNISLPATAQNYASQQWGQKLRNNCQ
jgi:RHS repeat-associated protein